MKIEQLLELLKRSSDRLEQAVNDLEHDHAWWLFMRSELWLHLRLTFKAWWKIIWSYKEEGK